MKKINLRELYPDVYTTDFFVINGSPRITRYSNTDKIVGAFERGLVNQGAESSFWKNFQPILDAVMVDVW